MLSNCVLVLASHSFRSLSRGCMPSIFLPMQVALDTFFWNPVMHVFVWGSILIWFVLIPIISTGVFYGSFFQFGGVAFEVLSTANFWFYLPLSAVIALAPTMLFRLIQLYRRPQYVDFVRLKEKKEGRKIFKRRIISRKSISSRSVRGRSGYAFSHQEGYANLITSGRIFGMDEEHVEAEHHRRRSILLSATPSRAGTERPVSMVSFPEETTSELAPPVQVSISDAVLKSGLSPTVSIEVVEEGENTTAHVETSASAAEKEASPPRDTTPTTGAGVDQTDSVLVPSVRIPGLVDSPPTKEGEKEEEASKEEKKAAESASGEGDHAEEVVVTVV